MSGSTCRLTLPSRQFAWLALAPAYHAPDMQVMTHQLPAYASRCRSKASLAKQNFPNAIADLSSCVELDNKYVLAYLQRANLQLLVGQCAESIADYQQVLALDNTKRDAHSRLPHAQACAQALQRAEHGRRFNNWQMVYDALGEAMADGRATNAPTLLMQRAEASLNMGEGSRENALADLARVLKLDSNNVKAYALRGKALYLHGDYATARAHFQSGLKVDPEHKDCKDGYKKVKALLKAKESADAALSTQKYKAAVEALEGSCELDAEHKVWIRECLPKLARAQWKAGLFAVAAVTARKAIAVDDGLAEAHYILAELMLRGEDWEEAKREAFRCVA